MSGLPPVGTRVVVRYRLPAGSIPPLTDVIGHLVDVGPPLRVRTKRGDIVEIATEDVVAVKALTDAPVRTLEIRNLEYAAASAWPGTEHEWLDGWLLRFGRDRTRRANSAVPLHVSAGADMGRIIDWYAARKVAPLVAAPDRLLRLPRGVPVDGENLVLACDIASSAPAPAVRLSSQPDDEWLRVYRRDVPVDVLTATIDGLVAFGTIPGVAVGRAAVTVAPDNTTWVGLSALRVGEDARGRGHARQLCAALLAWGADNGATRTYAQTLVDNTAATRLFESSGFAVHHRSRYVRADAL